MNIPPFFIPGIALRSYIIHGNLTCAVIDPSRDTGRYIECGMGDGAPDCPDSRDAPAYRFRSPVTSTLLKIRHRDLCTMIRNVCIPH